MADYQMAQRQMLTEDGYVVISQETSSESVVMNDGTILEAKMEEVDEEAINEEYTRRDIDNALLETISALKDEISKGFNMSTLTKKQLDLDNVENKSSETIRSEITKENVINALGYVPSTSAAFYQATEPSSNLVSGIVWIA
jgi:hypothetical protein